MSTAPPRRLVALYEWTTRLLPASHRKQYGSEQVRLFERVWREERPVGRFARMWWAARLIGSSVIAAIGVWLDRWCRAAMAQAAPKGGGGSMGSDLRFTIRSVKTSPWYAVTIVGVMAIVIAVATATLAIVDGVLFRPLPFPDAGSLVRIHPEFEGIGRPAPSLFGLSARFSVSHVDFEHWRKAVPDVPMTAFRASRWGGLGSGVNDDTSGMADVQPNFFDVLGVKPLFGGFASDDFVREAPMRPVLVTYQAWQGRFQGRPDIIGTEVLMDRASRRGVRVVGVMPSGFVFPSVSADISFLSPLVDAPSVVSNPTNRRLYEVVARLPRDVSPDTLRDRLRPAMAAVAALFPARGPKPAGRSDASWRQQGPFDALRIVPLAESLRERTGPLFRAAVMAVLLLVLIAAANVSSLMTARALERERELAVRRSLGAGWVALTRLWAVEAGLLLALAGALGLALTPLLVKTIGPLLPEDIVLLKALGLDWRVGAIVAIGITFLAACVSIVPIRRSLAATAPGTRGMSERVRSRARALVIAGQVAVAFALSVIGASLVGSVMAVYAQKQPITTEDVVAIRVMVTGGESGPGPATSAGRSARVERLRRDLLDVPGVVAASASGAQVLEGGGALPEFVAPDGKKYPRNIDAWPVTDGFYETLAPQLVAGRLPTSEELQTAAPVLVVSQRVAEAYWPGEQALGQTLVHFFSKDVFTVVGVVRDVRWVSWDEESPIVYAPYARTSRYSWVTFFLRTEPRHDSVLAEALAVIERTDPLARVRRVAPLAEYFRETISIRRFQSWLFGGFAATALIVVGAGLLGLLAMSVARRTREVGIRCALGATPTSVVIQVVREQMAAVLIGLLAGAGAAAWALGFIKSWLYQLTPADPRVWSAALACLIVMATIGILIPAVRASRVDPLKALRAE